MKKLFTTLVILAIIAGVGWYVYDRYLNEPGADGLPTNKTEFIAQLSKLVDQATVVAEEDFAALSAKYDDFSTNLSNKFKDEFSAEDNTKVSLLCFKWYVSTKDLGKAYMTFLGTIYGGSVDKEAYVEAVSGAWLDLSCSISGLDEDPTYDALEQAIDDFDTDFDSAYEKYSTAYEAMKAIMK